MLVSSTNKLSWVTRSLILVTIVSMQLSSSHAFSVVHSNGSSGSLVRLKTQLYMGQMNKRNKQADLMKKMQLAKQQKEGDPSSTVNDNNEDLQAVTDEEIKKRNDMKRFEELLNKEGATTRMSDDSYRTEEQELNEATASWKGKGGDRIFEGDPAPAEPFEELVSIGTENALGKAGAERLVPWLHKNVNRQEDYLVIITDPRSKSTDLRQTMKYLKGQLTPNILARLIVVNADTPPENKRWAKKNGAEGINIFSDEKREFMRQYTALGKDRWTMTMFIVQSGRVERLVRELDMDLAAQTVTKAVKSLSNR